jgi:hypothetical protein
MAVGTSSNCEPAVCARNAGWIFTRLFLAGSVLVVIWSVINLLIALLYNLVSDVLGGIEMSLVERR